MKATYYCTIVGILVIALIENINGATCPCSDPSLCDPITTPARNEVFVFSLEADNNTWGRYDWDKITTICIVGFYDPQLLCQAHSKGVRVVNLDAYPVSDLLDPDKRAAWIQQEVQDAQDKFLDGLNIDTEDPIPEGSPETDALTTLAQETTAAFQQAIPGSQVTFDIAWSPDGIDGRYYDAVGLANAVDFLFVMAYDEQSQIFDSACTARANSGLQKTISGIQEFLDLGIAADKLVLGVPWYGYNYDCVQMTSNNTCYIQEVPFRGANCSDAAGSQLGYNTVINILNTSTTGRLWDATSSSPYFNFIDTSSGDTHQMWYDDPESLGLKYQYAVDNSLRGVGMWTANYLDYSDTPEGEQQRNAMWGALPNYN